ncbi:MAG: pseudouridine synthase [Marinagarivorans sp.]|nr:pseudouridine synthase [Marinagarivorans sp.]
MLAIATIAIVFSHPDFVVVNKPAGIAVHAHNGATLLEQLRHQLGLDGLHPVHRLDLATSGLLIFAKTADANREFCQMFAARKVQKLYIALSRGKPKQKQGWVKGDMEKARGGSYKLTKSLNNPAITYLHSFGAQSAGQQTDQSASSVSITDQPMPRLWVMRPITGKTHQLRVALKSLAASILGDERYGGAPADRLYLHALALRFYYAGEFFDLMALPQTGAEFDRLITAGRLAALGDPWQLLWPASFDAQNASP